MKILLINPPIREDDEPSNFPLGIGYIARVLLDTGHQVDVLDINALRLSKDKVTQKLQESDADAFGITGLINQYSYLKYFLIKEIKRIHPEKLVVVGGGVASPIPKLFLDNTQADIVVEGEGEQTAVELFAALEAKRSLEAIDGIWYKDQMKGIMANKPRNRVERIDDIPFPAWHLFPMDIYLKNHMYGYGDFKDMNLIGSRGCPFRCSFCWDTFGKQTRIRSAKNVFDEIKELHLKYGVTQISFSDETFTVKRETVIEFCKLLKESKLPIKWGCNGRVNLVDEALLQTMKAAGCIYISYGIESGSQKILDEIQKDVTFENAAKAIKITQKAGIELIIPLIIGYWGETRQTINETVEFCKKTGIMGTFFYATPTPGSQLYAEARAKGMIPNEEAYVESLGGLESFSGKIRLNLTQFSDAELAGLKAEAEKKIIRNFLWKHKFRLPAMALARYRNYGMRPFINFIRQLRLLNKNSREKRRKK